MTDKKAFYTKLKKQLEDTTNFPADYMYKFIVPSNGNQQQEVENVFENKGAVIKTKKSKTGKYISISIVLKLNNAVEVIYYYKEVEKVEVIISL